MKKNVLCLALIALIAVSAVFAGGGKDAAPSAAGGPTIRLLTDSSGVDDKSYNAAAWRGILEFYGDTWNNTPKRGSLYDYITSQTQDMYTPILQQATDEGYDLIVATGFTWSDAVADAAKKNPRQKYMIVDVDWLDGSNILQTAYTEHEGSFLVGVAAALKAKEDGITNPRFGFIGGVPNPVIAKFEVGYVQGILHVIPNAQVVEYYVGDWARPDLAKTQAKNWYDSGVYIIYSAAGGSGNGTIAQAKEERLAGKNVWAIGVDSDQHEEGIFRGTESAVLTSMIKRVETSLIYGLTAVKNNTFRGEKHVFNLKEDGVGYAASNSALSPSIRTELESIKGRIINGQIKVAETLEESKRLPGFPQNLTAN